MTTFSITSNVLMLILMIRHNLIIFVFLTAFLPSLLFFFFFNDTATTEIYTLSLHDALPIFATAALLGLSFRDVSSGIVIKKSVRYQPEASWVNCHNRPLLRARDMGHAERVPDHNVAVLKRPVRAYPDRQTVIPAALVRIETSCVQLRRVVGGGPKMCIDEAGALPQPRVWRRVRHRVLFRHENVACTCSQTVFYRPIHDFPFAAARQVDVPVCLCFRAQRSSFHYKRAF